MRVGFITQLLWHRYGPFWAKLLSSLEVETVYPEHDATLRSLEDPRLRAIPGVAFQLAAAQALSLHDVDMLVVPDLNPGQDATRGSGQDPWIASLPEALTKTLGGLPQIIAVPATLDTNLDTVAVNTLHALTPEPALVRRVWERHRSQVKPARKPEPRWQLRPSETTTLGVVGQPWLLSDGLVSRLPGEGAHFVSQHQLEPTLLRQEGARVDDRLAGTDLEVLGAARFLGRRGSVAGLVMVVDKGSGADAWLAGRLERSVRKPLTLRFLDELASPDELVTLTVPTP